MDIFRIVFIITFLFSSNIYAQSKTELENQRKEILNDIRQIEKKLSNTKKEKGIIIGDVEDINFKIKLQGTSASSSPSLINFFFKIDCFFRNPMIDFNRDIWTYISMDYFKQRGHRNTDIKHHVIASFSPSHS